MDITRFLPLSNAPRPADSGVSTDERARIARVLDEAVRLIGDDREAAHALMARWEREAPGSDANHTLQTLPERVRAGRKRNAAELIRAVRDTLLLGDRRGIPTRIEPETLGRVAFHGSLTASFARRAVLRGHTVRATDAEWSFGRGPVLEAPAEQIVRFIVGISEEAPRAVSAADAETAEDA